MDNNYIGRPINFRRIEDNTDETINFRKTFDLNGTQNDEMLRLYLSSAGLSDEIECLTAEQRRAFIYDIIRSNKLPGYWLPSTFNNSKSIMQRPTTRPPPPPPSLPLTQATQTYNHDTIRSNASFDSLRSFENASSLLPQRFIPAPPAPPSPTTFLTSAKGTRYEISGPINFEHKSGDMTRDRTRNAFDLSPTSNNDNVLRKYMMERGITEDDIAGMRKPDVIRRIVQSKFTWMPAKKCTNSSPIEQQMVFATISKNTDATSMKSSSSYEEISLASNWSNSPTRTSPVGTIAKKDGLNFSNYTLVTSRFADCSQFPTPSDIYGIKNESKNDVAIIAPLPPLPPNAKRPAPPPRKSQPILDTPTTLRTSQQQPYTEVIYDPHINSDYDNAIETIPIQRFNQGNKQTSMQTNTFRQHLTQPLYVTLPDSNSAAKSQIPRATVQAQAMPSKTPSTNVAMDERLMAKQTNSAISKKAHNKVQPPPPTKTAVKQNSGIPPPPPPPPPPPSVSLGVTTNSHSVPAPPPMPATSAAFVAKPPSTLQSPLANAATSKQMPSRSALPPVEDSRDAFLESIRQGVALKKVNQKAATISGVKPRAERKPPVNDFLSELKLGITLRRIKNPEDNPFSATNDEPDESHA